MLLPPGRYVKVIATLPMPELVELVRELVVFEGEGLVYR